MGAVILLLALTNGYASDVDIRALAPPKPLTKRESIAMPQSGSNLNEIGGDWARRQFHLSSNGYDDELMEDTNRVLDRWFGAAESEEPNRRGPASTTQTTSSIRTLHMSKLGEFELGFGSGTKLHCDLLNGNELTLSKPIFQDIDLRLHHANTLNSVQLKFGW